MTPHITEFGWFKYLGGDLRWLERRRLARHVQDCALCADQRAHLERERMAFESTAEREGEWDRLASRVPRSKSHATWVAALATSAACVLAAVMLHSPRRDLAPKGGGLLVAYVKRGQSVHVLNERCAPGDRLRFHYETARGFLLILNQDPTGAVSPMVPPDRSQSQRLAATQGETPGAWALDERPGREHFFAFFSDSPVSVDDAANAVRGSMGRLPLLPGTSVVEVTCLKESP